MSGHHVIEIVVRTLNVLITITGKTAGYYIVYTGDFDKYADVFTDYHVDTAHVALAKDIFDMRAVTENREGKT